MKNTHPTLTAPAGLFVRAFLALLCLFAAVAARAELIAYESFNSYSTGAALDNKTGGVGWINEWHAIGTATVNSSSLTYTFPNDPSVTIGGGKSLKLAGNSDTALRRLIPPQVGGQTLYVSFLVQLRGGTPGSPVSANVFSGWQALDASAAHTTDTIGVVGAGGKVGARIKNTTTFDTPLLDNTTYFVVVKYTGWNRSRYKTVRVWLNPALEPETSAYNNARMKLQTAPADNPDDTPNYDGSNGFIGLVVRTVFANSSLFQLVDDIRIGTGWNDVVSVTPSPAEEPAHPALVVFGDSLSSGGASGVPATGPVPAPANGGFSRQTWIQKLAPAASYGVLHNSYAVGGTNYAIGGHTTSQMIGKVTEYLSSRGGSADPSALYVLWCGPNDITKAMQDNPFNFSSAAIAAANQARENMKGEIRRLAAAGATTFVWVDMPDLSKTPIVASLGYLGGLVAPTLQNATNNFNDGMNSAIAGIHADYPGATVHRMPANAWFADIIANKTAYGFTNVTGSSTTSNNYLFYDNVHPTARGHEVLANKAYDFFQSQGLLAD
jgi:Phospholipase/lecithinase/hemolysin